MPEKGLRSLPRTTLFVPDEELWAAAKAWSEQLGYESTSYYIFELLRMDAQQGIAQQAVVRALEEYYEWEHVTLGRVAEGAKVPISYVLRFLEEHRLPAVQSRAAAQGLHAWMAGAGLLPREFQAAIRLTELFKRSEEPSVRELLGVFLPDAQERTNEVLWVARRWSAEGEIVRGLRGETPGGPANLELAFSRLDLVYDPETLQDDPLRRNLGSPASALMSDLLLAAAYWVVQREVAYLQDVALPIRLSEQVLKDATRITASHAGRLRQKLPALPPRILQTPLTPA